MKPVLVELTDFKTKQVADTPEVDAVLVATSSPSTLYPALSSVAAARAGVPGVKPVLVELTDFKTKQVVDTLEVDAVLVATGRAPFTQARACACMLCICYSYLHCLCQERTPRPCA